PTRTTPVTSRPTFGAINRSPSAIKAAKNHPASHSCLCLLGWLTMSSFANSLAVSLLILRPSRPHWGISSAIAHTSTEPRLDSWTHEEYAFQGSEPMKPD